MRTIKFTPLPCINAHQGLPGDVLFREQGNCVSAQSQNHEAIATVCKTGRHLSHIHNAFEIYSIADSGNPKNKII